MFTEAFFISLTWAIVALVLISLIVVLIYLFSLHDNLEWTVRNNLDEAERYVKFLRLQEEAEKAKKQED